MVYADDNILYYQNKSRIGEFYQDESGETVVALYNKPGTHLNAHILREIADWLDSVNRQWLDTLMQDLEAD